MFSRVLSHTHKSILKPKEPTASSLAVANVHAQTQTVEHEGETFCLSCRRRTLGSQAFSTLVDAPAGPTTHSRRLLLAEILVEKPATSRVFSATAVGILVSGARDRQNGPSVSDVSNSVPGA